MTKFAKDKFDLFSIRKITDPIVLIRATPNLDCEKIIELASEGSFLMPTRVFCSLPLAPGFYQNTIPDILLKPAPRW